MRRKSLTWPINRVTLLIVTAALLLYATDSALRGAEVQSAAPALTNGVAKYLGANSCGSSSCHGGGGHNQNQFLVWSLRDFHSQRPFATLTTARSKQISDALQIKDPTADTRCASCHAPLHNVPSALRGESFRISEGVSCESCHGASETWLRSHTRLDYTHADRVAAGMRDLKHLYVRANTCVACHQTISPFLLKAGHPELIFELDGQSVSEPKHWREKTNWHGAQAWLVGQAAALRELAWQETQISGRSYREEHNTKRDALLWLLQRLDDANVNVPKLKIPGPPGLKGNNAPSAAALQTAADHLARQTADVNWTGEMTSSILATLAKAGADFRGAEIPAQQHARRAERLVLALERLLGSSSKPSTDARLSDLFKLTQSLPDFDPARFSAALDEFSVALKR